MAQGFKRTGNAMSTKKSLSSSSNNANNNNNNNKIRKGARIIAPKKSGAIAKANFTNKLTSQLNRRAESALITRLGGNREGTLKLVRPDSQIVDELKAKKAKKDAGRNGIIIASESKNKNEKKSPSLALNAISKSALQHLNEQEVDQENFDESENNLDDN